MYMLYGTQKVVKYLQLNEFGAILKVSMRSTVKLQRLLYKKLNARPILKAEKRLKGN